MWESILLTLGTATAKAVARIWVQSDYALDLSDGLVDVLAKRVPGLMERRRTARAFQDMADRVAQQLRPILENEFSPVPENERSAAVLAVSDLVESIQGTSGEILFRVDLEPSALETLLRKLPASRRRDELNNGAQLLYDRLLTETCNYIVELTIGLPGYTGAAITEVLRRESSITERVQQVLERLPQPAVAAAEADKSFDLKYRRHIARELDQLELFGLTLSDNASRYELSIAYITLAASIGTVGDQEVSIDEMMASGKFAETKSGRSRNGTPSPPTGVFGDDDSPSSMRVDQALARRSRHLIRGEAGSGKTTLLQWLAVTAAREDFADELSDWNGTVPFFLQLRRYANQNLPLPEEFLKHSAGVISAKTPEGWVTRQLESGRALMLIDGVDELPEAQRVEARRWLRRLMREYSGCKFVVTTRPPAVPEDWLQSENFGVLELLPMSLSDIFSFVNHWYDAAKRAVAQSEVEVGNLVRYESELVKVIRDTSSIRSLATAPLLCAMLCALNRDRRTQLPKDRMELYRVALESLLDRRDVEREIGAADRVSLTFREKQALLQDLAYWLILNEQSDVDRDLAVERVAQRLQFMNVSSSANDVFEYLLLRSGLIREPVAGRIDFIHRTFQEYLGAWRAISEGHVPLLVNHGESDHWREVIILAAGHANTSECDRLLGGLLDRGDEDSALRHRLHLLAAACLETAVELSPTVKARVQESLANALPPTNMTEARAVSSAGSFAAPLLAKYSRSRATTAAACVRALCLIGGEPSLRALKPYGDDRRVTVIRELLRGWEYFDRVAFAAEVLKPSGLLNGRLHTTDVEALAGARVLTNLRHLTFSPASSIVTLEHIQGAELVNELTISPAVQLSSLEGIGEFVSLASLTVNYNNQIWYLPDLPPSLRELSLSNIQSLTDMRAIVHCKEISLSITNVPASCKGVVSAQVVNLALAQPPPYYDDLSWLRECINLRSLHLRVTGLSQDKSEVLIGYDGSLSYIEGCNELKTLSLPQIVRLKSLEGLPSSLIECNLWFDSDFRDASLLAQCSNLESLMMDGASDLEDYTFLGELKKLSYLDLERSSKFSNLQDLGGAKDEIQILNIASTQVKDISPILDMPKLFSLDMRHCSVNSIDPLLETTSGLQIWVSEDALPLLPPELYERHYVSVERY